MWAIIGGSGFESFEEFEVIEELNMETPYGPHSSSLKKVKWKDEEVLFLSRHGSHHELLPSEINFRANIYALKKAGAKGILSFSAVGSLKEELKPEDLVCVNQYIDFTKKRASSFCEDGVIGHYSFAHPVDSNAVEILKAELKNLSCDVHFDKTYVCIEGPRFSSLAESRMFINWGADIIGMTNMPEAYLALEAGLMYLPFSFVTDYDCWKTDEDHVTLEIVKGRMKKNYHSAGEVLIKIVPLKIFDEFKTPSINEALMSEKKIEWI